MKEKDTPTPEKVAEESVAPAKQQATEPAKADRPGAENIERRTTTVIE